MKECFTRLLSHLIGDQGQTCVANCFYFPGAVIQVSPLPLAGSSVELRIELATRYSEFLGHFEYVAAGPAVQEGTGRTFARSPGLLM